jgi:hypothetical protein
MEFKRSEPASASDMLGILSANAEGRFGRYTGVAPSNSAFDGSAMFAQGNLRRIGRGLGLIEAADGARREQLIGDVKNIYVQAGRNPFFAEALAADTPAAAAVRERLHLVVQETPGAPGNPRAQISSPVLAR